jgi:molybdopterin converting factor small subunit
MQIRFYANFRSITDHDVLDLTDPGICNLRQLFDNLVASYPEISPHLLDERGELYPDVPIFINGRNPRLTNSGLDVVLEPEDVISLFSPISSWRMNVEVMRSSSSGEQE